MKKLNVHIEMADGQTFDVQSKTSDYIKYEKTARIHKWGPMAENMALWEAFIGWSAANRLGLLNMPWEQFIEEVETVDGRSAETDPTKSVVGDASS